MKFSTSIKVGKHEIFIEDEAADLKEMWMKLDSLQAIPDKGPNGEQELYFCHRKPKGKYDYFTIICPEAGQEFTFGQVTDGGALFPKEWAPIQHKLNGRYLAFDERTGEHEDEPDHKQEEDRRPQPLHTDRRDQYKAAMQAQAPAGKIIHPPCPRAIDADEWDARCAVVEQIVENIKHWNGTARRNWLIEQTQVDPFEYPNALYSFDAEGLTILRNAAADFGAPGKSEAKPEREQTPEQKFNLFCVQNGMAKGAYKIKMAHTVKGKFDYEGAMKEARQWLAERARQGASA